MKIPVLLDACEIYDRLTILYIKLSQCSNLEIQSKLRTQIEDLQTTINLNIGYDTARSIAKSEEYNNLYKVNLELFNLFDKLKTEDFSASIPDKLNYQRYLAKKQIQEKFFTKSIEEVKLGY